MSALLSALELVTLINPPLKKCMDDVKNNFFENMVRRNLQALNKFKLLLWSKQNYNKNDQQWKKRETGERGFKDLAQLNGSS